MLRRLAFALSILAAPAQAADSLTLALDWFVNPDHGPIIVAQERGLFEKRGLNVTIEIPADPADPPKFAAAGTADIAISYQPQLHLMVAEGLPIKRIGTLIATPLNCLLAKADGPVKTLADLKGRKVGISIPGVDEAVLATMLGTVGLTLDDIEVVNVNWALAASVMSEQVAASIGAVRAFQPTEMRLEGVEPRCFNVEEHGFPPYDELIFVANPETVDQDAARRFLSAIEEAAQWIVSHPEEGWAVFSATAEELRDELNESAWREVYPRFSLSPAALDAGRYARYEAFTRDQGLIEGTRPVSDLAIDLGAE